MSAVAIDPIAAILGAGDGRYEWADGSLIEMAPPSDEHGDVMGFLYAVMRAYAQERDAGRVMPDGYAQRLDADTVRIPDVAFFRKENLGRIGRTHSEGAADLIVEIVSPDSRVRDRRDKRFEYAKAGVEEYWIVDPERRSAEFCRLHEGVYETIPPDEEGKAISSVLPGFFIRIEWLWNQPSLLQAQRELGLL